MTDLWIACAGLAALSVATFALGVWIGRRSAWVRWGWLLGLGTAGAAYLAYGLEWVGWARWIGSPAVGVWSDARPWLAAGVAGALCVWPGFEGAWARGRVSVLAAAVTVLGWVGVWGYVVAEPLSAGEAWAGDVCLQTTSSTCTPAAAATLLRGYGVDTTEREMAQACRTRRHGTTTLGLVRGLRLMAGRADASLRVTGARLTQAELRRRVASGPVVVSVVLTEPVHAREPRYAGQWGWTLGVSHTVVVLGFGPGDRMRVADPNVGLEQWSTRSLKDLWTGDAVWIERREGRGRKGGGRAGWRAKMRPHRQRR